MLPTAIARRLLAPFRHVMVITVGVAFLCAACGGGGDPPPDETPDAGDINVDPPDAGEEPLPGDDVQAQVPSPPRNVVATAGDERATVTWTEPATNGGRAVTGYVITVSDGATYESTRTNLLVEGLTNGTAYTFRVVARNAVGDSAPSETSNEIVPFTVPGAPTEVVATPGMASATVTWLPPADDGGSPVTGYVVSASNGTSRVTSASTTFDYPGLINGATYTFVVTAFNQAGQGAPSAASNPVKPISVPGAPNGVLAERGDGKAIVSWVAPLSDGGSPITHYVVTASDGATKESTTTSVEFDNLTLGIAYSFTVVAFNAFGGGPVSIPSNEVVTITVPGPPRNVFAHRGDGNVTLEWLPPSSDGGSRVTRYEVHCSDGRVFNSDITELYVEELVNGEPYSFTVVALNAVGPGPESEPSNEVIPATVPGPPTNVTVTRGDGSLTVSWEPPLWDGGTPVIGYIVRENFSANHDVEGTTLTLYSTPQGRLIVGFDYAFSVLAVNDVGAGAATVGTGPITVITRPSPPASVTATRGDASATVVWSPGGDGGGTITGYRVTSNEGTTWDAAESPLVVEGLVNGRPYTFTVTTLADELGASEPSQSSNVVTPATVPQAPTEVTVVAGFRSAELSWTAPPDGGTPITGYVVTPVPMPEGRVPEQTTGTSYVFDRLDSSTTYRFVVEAVNELGRGPASAQSNAVVPGDVAGQPTNVVATLDGTTALVSWTPPAFIGGSAIVGYEVSSSARPEPYETTQTEVLIEGLARGQTLTFAVRARNGYGLGLSSEPSEAVFLPDYPGTPEEITAMVIGDGAIRVRWGLSTDGGSPITDYEITSNKGTVYHSDEPSLDVTGLTGGVHYTFTIRARNEVGFGGAATSDAVMAETRPSPVSNVVAVIHDTGVKVTWNAPASDGGRAIQTYRVKVGEMMPVDITAPATTAFVTGLFENMSYTPVVTAINPVGASNPASGSPVTYIDREWAQWTIPATLSYSVVGDVVNDLRTGLKWQRTPSPSALAWAAAKSYCDALSLGGANDWRLPTFIELSSLVDLSGTPTIDTTVFPGTYSGGASVFWTATPWGEDPTGTAVTRRFDNGKPAQSAINNSRQVRCVR